MLAFFALGAVGFFVVMVSLALGLLAFVEHSNFIGAGFVAVTAATFFFFAGGDEAVKTILQNPQLLIAAVLLYLVVGVVWAFIKWAFKVSDAHRRLLKLKGEVESGMMGAHQRVFDEFWKKESSAHSYAHRPLAKFNKLGITTWMMYWPFSVINFLFLDLVKRLGQSIYRLLARWFESLSRRLYPSAIDERYDQPPPSHLGH